MLNFRQFLQNASQFLTQAHDLGGLTAAVRLPEDGEIPTKESRPVLVHGVVRRGKSYEVRGENNMVWNCPTQHFEYLRRLGKAPEVGDKVQLTFHLDGSVKSFRVV